MQYANNKYKPKYIILIEFNENLPIFGIIKNLITVGEKVIFIYNRLLTTNRNQHFFSYEAELLNIHS